MLFIGTITRLIEGNRHKHNHEPVADPVAIGVSMPQHARCILCSEGSTQSRNVHIVAPIVAAAPVLSHHDTRREWKYERRAMRGYHRAARHGYGHRHPITISYAPGDYEAGSSTPRALPDYRRAALGASCTQKLQHEAPPPRYETMSRDLDPRRPSVEALTEVKGT